MTNLQVPRVKLLPSNHADIPAWSDMCEAIDTLFKQHIEDPSLLYLDLRDLTKDSDRYVLKNTASMLGFAKKSWYLNEDRLNRIVSHLPKFRNVNTTEAYKNFLGFLTQYPMGVDYLWTDDYCAFFSVAYGSELLSPLGERLQETQIDEGWYNTTHVLIRANPATIFPDAKDPYEALTQLFRSIAPAYLVLEFIGNIADFFETRLTLNIGVVEGHTIDEHQYIYENLALENTEWVQGSDLPINLRAHQQTKLSEGTALITGGCTNNRINEKLAWIMKLEQSEWISRYVPFADDSDVTAIGYCEASATLVIGSSSGELALSKDGGETWDKQWSPFFDSKRPITGLCWSKDHNLWIAVSADGFYVVTEDPAAWDDGEGVRHPLNLAFEANEFAAADYTPEIVANGVVAGNGVFLIYCNAGVVFRSQDGSVDTGSWSKSVTKEGYDLYGAAYDIDRAQFLLAGKCGWGFITTNGQTFAAVDIGVGDYDVKWVTYVPQSILGRYILGGRNNTYAVSTDGRLWELCDPKFRTDDITVGGYLPWINLYFAAGNGKYAVSKDSITWNLYEIPFKNSWERIYTPLCWLYIPTDRRILMAGTDLGLSTSIAAEKFYSATNMTVPRAHHLQFTFNNGNVMVAGGESLGVNHTSVEEYNPETNSWATLTAMPVGLRDAAISYIPASDSADAWTLRSSKFGTIDMMDIAYLPGADQFWGVGQYGRVSVSQYGLNWVPNYSPFPVNNLVGATYNINKASILLASNSTPSNTKLLIESVDGGVTWTSNVLTISGSTFLNDFTYIERAKPDLLLLSQHRPVSTAAAGATYLPNVPTVARSADGKVWQTEDLTARINVPTRSTYYADYSIRYQRYFIAVDGGIAYSPDDGVNWRFATSPGIDPAVADMPWLAVAEGAGLTLALDASGQVHGSYDGGATWDTYLSSNHESISDLKLGTVGTAFSYAAWKTANKYQEWTSALVYYDDGVLPTRWICVNTAGNVKYSLDNGVTWTDATSTPAFSGGTTPHQFRLQVDNAGAVIRAVGGDSNLYVSTDGGDTWINFTIQVGTVIASGLGSLTVNTSKNVVLLGDETGTTGLWSIRASDHDPTTCANIAVRMDRPTGLTGTFVSGRLQQQLAQYQVTALDGNGETRPSEVWSIQIPASTEGAGISLEWNPVADCSGYKVYGRVAGSMRLLATLPASETNFVDDGSVVGDTTVTVPLTDTSGLAGVADLKISVVTYIASLDITVVATKGGALAWSRDLVSWIGVRNPCQSTSNPYTYGMGYATFLLARESTSLYVAAGQNGGLALSSNGNTWDTSHSNTAYGDLSSIGYSSTLDQLVIGTSNRKMVTSTQLPALVSSGTGTTIVRTSGASDRDNTYYRYWIVKRRNVDVSGPGYAMVGITTGANTDWFTLSWARDGDCTGYDVYRQESATAAFTTPTIKLLGTVRQPDDPTITTITFVDRYDDFVSDGHTFTGTLDDINITNAGYVAPNDVYRVKISVVDVSGAVDLVTVQLNDGQPSDPIAMPLYPGTVNVGTAFVTVNWTANTGHALGDTWIFTIRPNATTAMLPTGNNSGHVLGQNWTAVDAPLGTTTNCVRWIVDSIKGTSSWVSVGNYGSIVTSVDGETWNTMSIHAAAVGSTNLFGIDYAVTAAGTATTVVVVGEQRLVTYSDDFFNTSLAPASSQGFSGSVQSVTFNPGTRYFTAVGQDSGLGTSTDGRNWTMVYLDNTITTWRSADNGGGAFQHMVVGDYGAFATSRDGKLWVTRDIGYATGTVWAIIPDGSTNVVMAGDRSTIMFSADSGSTWNQQASPVTSDLLAGCYITGTVSRWILVGKDGSIVTSENGTTWTSRVSTTTVPFVAVATKAGSNLVMAVTTNSRTIYRSLDGGLTWAPVPSTVITAATTGTSLISGYTDICCSPTGVWVATSYDGKVSRSTDNGDTWSTVTVTIKPWYSRKYQPSSPALIDFNAVTFGDGVFVIGGTQGDILVSTDGNATAFVLKDSRLNGTQLNSLDYSQGTFLAAGHRGALVTSFAGFGEKLLITGGTNAAGAVSNVVYRFDRGTGVGGTWSVEAKTMLTARSGHSQSTMQDNTVLVSGGIDDTYTPLKTTERYLPHRDLWVSDLPMPYAKGWLRSVVLKSGAYVVTGAGTDPFDSALVLLPPMVTPAAPVLSPGPGILAPGSYFYRISAATAAGETVPTEQVKITLTETGGVVVDWEAVDNTVEYVVYGRQEGAATIIARVPGHLTSYTDLGISLAGSTTFKREDTTKDGWFELKKTLPLPREYHAQCLLDQNTISITGGYNDKRVYRLIPTPYTFVLSNKDEQSALFSYVADSYWATGYVTLSP